MKKLAIICMALFAITLTSFAQGQRRGPRGHMNKETMVTRMTERQTKRLALTPEQAEKMKVLNTQWVDQMMTQRRPADQPKDSVQKLSKEERRAQRQAREAQMKEAREAYHENVKKVLTPEQYETFVKMEEERPNRQRPHGERGRGPRGNMGGMDRMGDFGGDSDGFDM